MRAKIISRPGKEYPLVVEFVVVKLCETTPVERFPIANNNQNIEIKENSIFEGTMCYSRPLVTNLITYSSVTPYAQTFSAPQYFDSHSFKKKIVQATVINAYKQVIGWELMDLERERKFCLLWRGRPCEIVDLGKDVVKIIKLY